MKLLSEGAEAKIYLINTFAKKLALKSREPKRYRQATLDEKIRRERTKREAKIISRLGSLGVNVPKLVAVGKFSIMIKMLDGILLKDTRPNLDTMVKAGRLLAAMHKNDIAHGDFTPANLMLFKKSVYVIDFGLSEFTKSLEEKAIDLLLMKRAISYSQYKPFEDSYKENYQGSKDVIERLDEIEKRGRYQIRTIA